METPSGHIKALRACLSFQNIRGKLKLTQGLIFNDILLPEGHTNYDLVGSRFISRNKNISLRREDLVLDRYCTSFKRRSRHYFIIQSVIPYCPEGAFCVGSLIKYPVRASVRVRPRPSRAHLPQISKFLARRYHG